MCGSAYGRAQGRVLSAQGRFWLGGRGGLWRKLFIFLEVKTNGATHFRPNSGEAGMSGPRRIPEIRARLDRWAIWRVSDGGGGPSGNTIAYLMDLAAGRRVHADTAHSSFVPVDELECARTDDAVNALPVELRQAVCAWHGASSGTMDEVARRLGVVKTTLWRRLGHADHRIAEFLSACRCRNK